MTHSQFDQYLSSGDFRRLFIDGLGWNNFPGASSFTIAVCDDEFEMKTIAQRSGFQIIVCKTETVPTASLCKKIDTKLRRFANDYICIFQEPGSLHHLWVVPVKSVEKRELVCVEYTSLPQASFLYSKLQEFTFGIEEETLISDVKECVQKAFAINSEKITKDFYAGFKKEHTEFAKFITGVNDETDVKDNKDKQWYTSVMLNRLMFCYFIQKKGFLNNDTNYLRNKLEWTKAARGENQFFESFYRGFLSRMFHDGLNAPSRNRNEDFEDIYGRIPYLNGGMFDEHQIEKDYENLDIADGAFERLFDFFDKWEWHLDTRVTATGKDINPDVLGYIFEQYINDRAQIGAYYTKEDITEYIGKNCIIPFLFDKVSKSSASDLFSPSGYIWTMLKESGTKYFYPAAIKGWSLDWKDKLPASIKSGLDTTAPNLLERRSHWNENTSEEFALPTEIWRETIERLKLCDEIVEAINSGSISNINDFITYNLNIRSLTYDILANTKCSALIKAFYEALQNVSILDPTCGSGAFLFAAMNILDPLYEICIERMQEFNENDSSLFNSELSEITDKYRSNIQYFIFKSIILRNLYGVDIMVEATEIAKLRLFLKMVSVVEVDKRADNLGLDPLPDIDFNIRCGNTLVGYATETQLNADLEHASDLYIQFANQELKAKLEAKMRDVAETYDIFRLEQLRRDINMATFKQTKATLNEKLYGLNDLLNRHLYASTCGLPYDQWLKIYQPFHWLAEFYQIMHDRGGFDVIIGNPPYVEYSKRNVQYLIRGYETESSSNLYSFVFERSTKLTSYKIGFIIQMSAVGTDSMKTLQNYLLRNSNTIHYSCYPERPKQLFDGACIALSILLCNCKKDNEDNIKLFSAGINRTTEKGRSSLFQSITYCPISHDSFLMGYSLYPKFKYKKEESICSKLLKDKSIIRYSTNMSSNNSITYRTAGGRYYKIVINRPFATESTSNKTKAIIPEIPATSLVAILNSNLMWWYYANYFDLYNFKDYMIFSFCYTIDDNLSKLAELGHELMNSYERNKITKKQFIKSKNKESIFESFNPQLSKSIIDRIDKELSLHYGFSEEELDFIINYDIKYRLVDDQHDVSD